MTEHEAKAFLETAHFRCFSTPSEKHRAYLAEQGGYCRKCFHGDYWEPPWMCGDCEDAAIEAGYAAAARAFWDELEYERDCAFDAMLTAPTLQAKDKGE